MWIVYVLNIPGELEMTVAGSERVYVWEYGIVCAIHLITVIQNRF